MFTTLLGPDHMICIMYQSIPKTARRISATCKQVREVFKRDYWKVRAEYLSGKLAKMFHKFADFSNLPNIDWKECLGNIGAYIDGPTLMKLWDGSSECGDKYCQCIGTDIGCTVIYKEIGVDRKLLFRAGEDMANYLGEKDTAGTEYLTQMYNDDRWSTAKLEIAACDSCYIPDVIMRGTSRDALYHITREAAMGWDALLFDGEKVLYTGHRELVKLLDEKRFSLLAGIADCELKKDRDAQDHVKDIQRMYKRGYRLSRVHTTTAFFLRSLYEAANNMAAYVSMYKGHGKKKKSANKPELLQLCEDLGNMLA